VPPPINESTEHVSSLVKNMLPAIRQTAGDSPVLDLACGGGRNGSYLVNQGLSVVFADQNQAMLASIPDKLKGNGPASFWHVDLQQPGCNPLAEHYFACILIFRYLHRPLMPFITEAVMPGGLVIYETFTSDQPRFGRPNNPDFLLEPGELRDTFSTWETLHCFEGISRSETGDREQAIAQIVARKPRLPAG